MNKEIPNRNNRINKLFGWIGAIILLLIIPMKLFRFLEINYLVTIFIGITPSILGTAGLLFLVLSSVGKLSKLTLLQKTILVGCISLGLEFLQLLPRPSLLKHIFYTFDWFDIISSLVSLGIAYFIAKYIIQKYKSC